MNQVLTRSFVNDVNMLQRLCDQRVKNRFERASSGICV